MLRPLTQGLAHLSGATRDQPIATPEETMKQLCVFFTKKERISAELSRTRALLSSLCNITSCLGPEGSIQATRAL